LEKEKEEKRLLNMRQEASDKRSADELAVLNGKEDRQRRLHAKAEAHHHGNGEAGDKDPTNKKDERNEKEIKREHRVLLRSKKKKKQVAA